MIVNLLHRFNLYDSPNGEAARLLRCVTKKDMDASKLRRYLRENKLWWLGPDGGAGRIQDGIDLMTDEAEKEASNYLWALIFGQADKVSTAHDAQVAKDFADAVKAVRKATTRFNLTHEAEIYALANGLHFPDGLTGPEVKAAKDAYEAQQAEQEQQEQDEQTKQEMRDKLDGLFQTHVDPVIETLGSNAEMKAAIALVKVNW